MHPSILDTSIIDLLEADPRPSFIVALAPLPPTVVYTNPAFATCPTLLDLITAKGDDCAPLWEWITGAETRPGPGTTADRGRPAGLAFSYSNIHWTRSVVHEQMVVVGANEQAPWPQSPRKVRLDASDPQPGSAAPTKRIMPVEPEPLAAVATGNSSSALSVPEPDSRPKASPTTLPINPKDRPPSRAEAVQSLGLSISDPRWILPDTTPGTWLPVLIRSRASA
jgi:hypothetical protein